MRLNWSFWDNSEDIGTLGEVGEVVWMILTIFMNFGLFPSQLWALLLISSKSERKRYGPMDQQTDQRMDGRTHPLIEMRGRI